MIHCKVLFFARQFLVVLLVLTSMFLPNGIQGQVRSGDQPSRQSHERCDSLMFREPAKHFRPQIWYHFISGNITAEGVKADMKAIHEAGFSGIQLFHEHRGGEPWPGMDNQVKCLSQEWDSLIRKVAEECQRYGLKFTMQNCPGWAMAGGPWIEPRNAMRHLVWSRQDVQGGRAVSIRLPHPMPGQPEWRDYREVAIVAFPTPVGDTGEPLEPVEVISNRKESDWDRWVRREKESSVTLEASEEPTRIEFVFGEEVTIRTIEFPSVRSLSHGWEYDPQVEVKVEALHEDKSVETVASLNLPRSNWQEDKPLSIGCRETTSKRYRLSVTNRRYTIKLNPVTFWTAARKTNWEGEAAWVLREMKGLEDPEQRVETRIKREEIVDITEYADDLGNLNWEVPPGRWTILRWGHVNTGMLNGSAPWEATGHECNKLSVVGADTHFAGYIGRLSGENGPLKGNLLNGMLMDSWECGTQTWTDDMPEAFRGRRGYDLIPWLPAIAGYIVETPEITSRFLRDWRATLNNLLVDNFYGRMTELAHEHGLTTYYETASGDVFPADILEYYKHADVPMCEFWHPRTDSHVGSIEKKSVKPTVSAARLYGKNRVAAESFTSGNLTWNEHPGMLKPVIDLHFAKGVTFPVFQAYTHTPWKDIKPPGTSFGGNIGTPFLRGQTWWGDMPAFTRYLSRCTYMLENGRPVSDVLFFLGDETDHKPRQNMPFPDGYQYDYCNPDVLLHRLTVRNGRIETPEGLSYRLLWLPDNRRMLPETVERLIDLVKEGAVIVGNPPESMATLSGGSVAEARFSKAVHSLWGKTHKRQSGRGKVLPDVTIAEALGLLKIQPDLIIDRLYSGSSDDLQWLHRQNNTGEWYFITAPESPAGLKGILKFRATGKAEIWDPLTGKVTKAVVHKNGPKSTSLEISLPPSGSLFVLFRSEVEPGKKEKNKPQDAKILPLSAPWKIKFQPGWGAPDSIVVDSLIPWKDLKLSDEAKAYSGTVCYQTTFEIDRTDFQEIALELGKVNMTARVRINGTEAGTLWTGPYRLDITHLVRNGINQLEIEVTSTWFNRLVFDAGQDEASRKTWTISGPSGKAELLPYGLLGPVTLEVLQAKESEENSGN